MSGIDVKAHGGRNCLWKSYKSQFDIYVLHWSCLSELKWKMTPHELPLRKPCFCFSGVSLVPRWDKCIPLACAECDNSLMFSGASSIPLCYVLFPATLLHQLFFHPLSPHLAIYFLVYLNLVPKFI